MTSASTKVSLLIRRLRRRDRRADKLARLMLELEAAATNRRPPRPRRARSSVGVVRG
jgi:hypothetical protein